MKIKELGHTAENLIEQGEQTQREINMRQSELGKVIYGIENYKCHSKIDVYKRQIQTYGRSYI